MHKRCVSNLGSPFHTLSDERDIGNFVSLRDSAASDDQAIGGLLVEAFTKTYARLLPELTTDGARILELLNSEQRRRCGAVRALELGHRIIGTYALLRPGTAECQAWLSDAASLRSVAIDPRYHGLRFSQLLLEDAAALARAWGATSICLHVQNGADGVARTYARFGFKRDPLGDLTHDGNRLFGYTLGLAPASVMVDAELVTGDDAYGR